MDDYSVKRAVDGLVVPKRGTGIVLRDATEGRDKNAQFCNRLGCKGRLNHTKISQNGCSGKFKSSRPPSIASNGKEIIGTSTSTRSVVANTRKSVQQSQKSVSFRSETGSSETSSIQSQKSPSFKSGTNFSEASSIQDEREAFRDSDSGKDRVMEVGSSSVSPNNSSRKVCRQKSGVGTQATPLGISEPLASRRTNQGVKNSANTSRYGLGSLRCNSISDVPSGSSSESNLRKKDVIKKRNSEVESSSSGRGKKMGGPLSEDSGYSTLNRGIYISDSRCGPTRTQRSTSSNTRSRLSNNRSRMELPVLTPQMSPSESSIAMEVPCSSHRFSTDVSSSHSMSFSHPGSSERIFADMLPMGPAAELAIPSSLMNYDGLRRYNVEDIAEALLALERIEQNEELTYEQLLALDANVFLGGLGFYDQHREMRLDIDNMSYEELLALEETMGSVSTALSEEALSKCLRSSIYQPRTCEEGSIRGSRGYENEVKCSICQEEYNVGDEVGRLKCEHGYHKACINQWLRLKNWCPICKASVAHSPE